MKTPDYEDELVLAQQCLADSACRATCTQDSDLDGYSDATWRTNRDTGRWLGDPTGVWRPYGVTAVSQDGPVSYVASENGLFINHYAYERDRPETAPAPLYSDDSGEWKWPSGPNG